MNDEYPGDRASCYTVTALLREWQRGDVGALEELTPLVYEELRRIAGRYMVREAEGHVLQTTALVHEAFLRLVDADVSWRDRLHFYAVCASTMRRILVDFARRRRALRRGGTMILESLDDVTVETTPDVDLIFLDEALERLARLDARKARVVELKFFAGLTLRETASLLEVSTATVERDLSMAKAWLARAMSERGGDGCD